MRNILISDPTLRDGNHAAHHQLTKEDIRLYTRLADEANIPIIEVGHGNGIGASSLQLGQSAVSDYEMLQIARENIHRGKLGIHVIPGFATIKKDLSMAIDVGVDVVRVASHCVEADLTRRHIEYASKRNVEVYGVLMMSHMATTERLVDEARKMEFYGAQAIIIMDSAGAYIMDDVRERIGALVSALKIPVGFHAHNNLGLAIGNSIAAVEAGATILDGTARGFGAGAGNAKLEVLVFVLDKMGYTTGINKAKLLTATDTAETFIERNQPVMNSMTLVSGIAGVFSAFSKPVKRIAKEYGVSPHEIMFELGRRQIIAGQEDIILEVAIELASGRNTREGDM